MLEDLKKQTGQRMHKSLDSLKQTLAKVRTGRAHVGLLDHVEVEYYGTPTLLNQVASISLLDARTLSVSPFEKKMAGAIEKAIRDSDLGLNPASLGDLVRVPMPPLTEERRKELIKVVRHEAEESRVAVRNQRRDANETLKRAVKDKQISEDEERRGGEEVQKLTDRSIAEIDRLLAEKEKELMTV